MVRHLESTVCALILATCLMSFSSCGIKEMHDQKAKLDSLLKKRATRAEVIQLLGTNFIDDSVGSTNRGALMQFLQREPTNRWVEIRQKVAKWPNSIFYSTPEVMTFVFFDDKQQVADFALSAQ